MKNIAILKDISFEATMGDWSVQCHAKTFKFNNKGIKLWAKRDEKLRRVIFNLDKKSVEVVVDNPTLPEKVPRVVDLSEAVEFFEEVRANFEEIMTTGTYQSVIPNEDRTIFEIS